MKSFGRLRVLSVVIAGFLLSAGVAKGDDLSITLASPFQTYITGGSPGVVSFTATVTAIDAAGSPSIYLNGDSSTVDSPFSVDDGGFFANLPIFMNPGDSVDDLLFAVDIPSNAPVGLYTGTFEIMGGPDGGTFTDFNVLGSADFNVLVTTPEPSSLVFLLTGFCGLAETVRRRGRIGIR